MTLEDLSGILDVILLPTVYRQARYALSSGGPLLVYGSMEMDSTRGEPLLRAEKVAVLVPAKAPA
jgi:hypothetical protein